MNGNNDGTKMLYPNSSNVNEYILSTGFDISNADARILVTDPAGMSFD